jgi:flagellar hook protein FlgE
MGSLIDFTVSGNGVITGIYSNGLNQVLGQIALANFGNPGGLTRVGSNLFEVSVNSGEPLIGAPGSGGRGSLYVGALEMSNVDLASEFTNMIITQRGFQANSRIITTSDEMLQELVNLKR